MLLLEYFLGGSSRTTLGFSGLMKGRLGSGKAPHLHLDSEPTCKPPKSPVMVIIGLEVSAVIGSNHSNRMRLCDCMEH